MIKYRILFSIPFFILLNLVLLILFGKDSVESLHISREYKHKGQYYLVPVVLFHDIDGKGPYSVTREEFRDYMQILKKQQIQVISLKTLYEHAVKNEFFDKPTIVITIDDNYTNIVRVLAPILREFSFSATFFFYISEIRNHPSKGTSWEDLNRLLQEGFDIQNHSYSHKVFHKRAKNETEEEYQNKIYKEVILSKNILEQNLKNHKIWAFAYPMGYYTEDLNQFLFQNEYKVVLTTDAIPLDLRKPFDGIIHRYTIQKKYVKDPVKMFYKQISYAKRKINN